MSHRRGSRLSQSQRRAVAGTRGRAAHATKPLGLMGGPPMPRRARNRGTSVNSIDFGPVVRHSSLTAMKSPRFTNAAALAVASFLFLPAGFATPLPDFQLPDENPNSPRFGQVISPRQYQEQVSAYYFGLET
jgi:hypothetical protein